MGDKTRKIKGTGSAFGKTGGYKPFVRNEKGAGHSSQPDGKSIGYGSKRAWSKGNEASGSGREHSEMPKNVAGTEDARKHPGHMQKHSSLTYKDNEGGKSFGVAGFGKGESFKGRLGSADRFRNVGSAESKSHTFRHTGGLKQGALRMSGDSRAHQVGCRKK